MLHRPQTWNRYSYAYNSPVGLLDPDGAMPKSPPDIVVKRHRIHLDNSEISQRNPLPHVDVSDAKGNKIGRIKSWGEVFNGTVPESVMDELKHLFDQKKLPKAWMRGLSKWGVPAFGGVSVALDIIFADDANADDDGKKIRRFHALAEAMFDKPFSELTAQEWQAVIDAMSGRAHHEPEPKQDPPCPQGKIVGTSGPCD